MKLEQYVQDDNTWQCRVLRKNMIYSGFIAKFIKGSKNLPGVIKGYIEKSNSSDGLK